jgi:hypothetical protein
MQWIYVLLATGVTFAGLIYVHRKQRKSENEELPTPMKLAMFFSLFLIYFGIFYYFDDESPKMKPFDLGFKHSAGHASPPEAEVLPEISRIRNIREDCYEGIAPF